MELLGTRNDSSETPAQIAFKAIIADSSYIMAVRKATIKMILELGPKITTVTCSNGKTIIEMAHEITDPELKKAVADFLN
jgi:hypothetical protein